MRPRGQEEIHAALETNLRHEQNRPEKTCTDTVNEKANILYVLVICEVLKDFFSEFAQDGQRELKFEMQGTKHPEIFFVLYPSTQWRSHSRTYVARFLF